MKKKNDSEHVSLADRMRDRAKQTSEVDVRSELLRHADALDGVSFEMPIPQLVATWAKARKFWSDLTGEPLV